MAKAKAGKVLASPTTESKASGYRSTRLDNGLRVITTSMPHTHAVTVGYFVGAGSRYESDRTAGSTHFLEHLLFKGTRDWPTAKTISETIEGTGGIMNASTEREMTTYWCKVAKPHASKALSVLTDMVLHPLLDQTEMEKERQVILEELRMSDDYPSHRVDLLIDEMMWPNQPMGRDVGGTKESVSGIVRDDLLDMMRNQYVPNNVVLSAAGAISHDEVLEQVAEATREWKPGQPWEWSRSHREQNQKGIKVESRKTEQAHICIGLPGLPLDHPDRYALMLMNTIFGEGMSSRLFLEVRERLGLAYDVHSSVSQFHDTGAFVVYCGTEPSRSPEAVEAIMREMGKLTEGFSGEEMDKAKELTKGRLLLRMEDSRSVAMWQGAQELLLEYVNSVEDVIRAIDAVTLEDLNRATRDIVKEDQLNLAVVGPFRTEARFRKAFKL
jgi:predicted Zn-dependent peptidase